MMRIRYYKNNNELTTNQFIVNGEKVSFRIKVNEKNREWVIYLEKEGAEPVYLTTRKIKHTAYRFVKAYLKNTLSFPLGEEKRRKNNV